MQAEDNSVTVANLALDEWCYSQSLLSGAMTHFDIIRRAGELGVQGVGLDYFLMPEEAKQNPARLRDALKKNGLELVLGFGFPFAAAGVAWPFLQGRLKQFFAVAAACEVNVCRVVGGVVAPIKGFPPLHLSLGKQAEIKETARNLKRFCRQAQDQGLVVALEYHMDYTAREMLEILERANAPNLKITLDTGNAMHLGEDPLEVARLLIPHTAFTHLKDMRRVGNHAECALMGTGQVSVAEIAAMLKAGGYSGLYCLENALSPAQKKHEDEWVEKGIGMLRNYSKKMAESPPPQ